MPSIFFYEYFAIIFLKYNKIERNRALGSWGFRLKWEVKADGEHLSI